MTFKNFIAIGENIHCTRSLKKSGNLVDANSAVIHYKAGTALKTMPVPEVFLKSSDWAKGKIRHCAAAVWQGMFGIGAAREAGCDYLRAMALAQEQAGAAFLDINVDEFSSDVAERKRAMQWLVELVQQTSKLPVSIDSSNSEIVRAGIAAAGTARAMLNSISLERLDLLDLIAASKPAVIVSAAGEQSLPATTQERLANLERIMPMLTECGLTPDMIYIDPLVYTISTDSRNGLLFLEAVRALRAAYGAAVHITGGLSNVSFGMPARKLINHVFAELVIEAGGDSGIVDPLHINGVALRDAQIDSESRQLACALLLGEDEFGMNFIMAHREGRLRF